MGYPAEIMRHDRIRTMRDETEAKLLALDELGSANPFWKKRIRKPELGFKCVSLTVQSNRDDEKIEQAFRVSEKFYELSKEISTVTTQPQDYELSTHIFWMRINGIYDEVLDFLDERRLKFSSVALRWYIYSKKIAALCEDHVGKPARILEIGAGGGEMAYFIHEMRPWSRYVIIDLAPMLTNLYSNLRSKMPDARFWVNEWPSGPNDEPWIILLDTAHANMIPDESMDVGLNFNSFMEMDRQIRDEYIEQIYRVVGPGGVFYNVNRRQHQMTNLDGSTFDNHPLFYPYRTDDKILEFDLDYSQQDVRCHLFHSYPGLPISRIAIVKPDDLIQEKETLDQSDARILDGR